MRKGGGKAKGASFEREIAKKLSLWLTYNKEEDGLWRSAMSGGRATVGKKSGKDLSKHAGDLSATSEIAHKLTNKFLIEIKHYNDLQILNVFFETDKGNLLKFWNKLVKDCTIYNKMPMLIAKQNRLPTLVCLDSDGYATLLPNPPRTSYSSHNDMYLLEFDEFLKHCDPAVLFK